MNFTETLFLIQLLAILGISTYKAINITKKGTLYELPESFLLFAGSLVCWFFALIVFLNNVATSLEYLPLFQFTSFIMVLNVFFLIAEIFLGLSKQTQEIHKKYESNFSMGANNRF